MKTKSPIKVIKRDERGRRNVSVEESAEIKKSAQESARDMVATVSGWVSEFQQKRRSETRQAIKTLFPDATPQPS